MSWWQQVAFISRYSGHHQGAIKTLRISLWLRYLDLVFREMSECGQLGLISVLILLVQALKRNENRPSTVTHQQGAFGMLLVWSNQVFPDFFFCREIALIRCKTTRKLKWWELPSHSHEHNLEGGFMICLMEPLLVQSWRQPFQANGSSLCGENHIVT